MGFGPLYAQGTVNRTVAVFVVSAASVAMPQGNAARSPETEGAEAPVMRGPKIAPFPFRGIPSDS